MSDMSVASLVWIQFCQIAMVATLVWGVVHWFGRDRPSLAHALWALVLIKCLTPPLWRSPIGLMCWIPVPFSITTDPVPRQLESEIHLDTNARSVANNDLSIGSNLGSTPRMESWFVELWDRNSWSLATSLLLLWFLSVCFAMLVVVIRYRALHRRLESANATRVPHIDRLADDLRCQLGITERLRVRVLDLPCGPFVIGLLHPQVILPKCIVDSMDEEPLRMLIAHEMIHIRRRDLVWSALQSTAVCVWWFHPMVWIANRRLSEESERSCDEETISSLGCSAAAYARCLVKVLEERHRLHVSPALPGVHPVQITSMRLERIMKMRHGSRTNPNWVRALMLGAGCVVLPGALWVQAQPPNDPTAHFQSQPSLQPSNAADERTASADGEPEVERTYDVSDILKAADQEFKLGDQVVDFLGRELGFYNPLPVKTTNAKTEIYPNPVKAIPAPPVQRLTTPTRPYRIVDGRLTVSATPSQHSAVEATIAKRRENGWKLFISKVHLYSSQQEIKLDGVEGVHLQHIASDPQSAFAVLNQQQLATLRQRIQGTDQITTIAAPILITMSGDTSCMSTNTQTAFAVDVDDTGEPVGQLIETGVRIDFSQKYVDDKTEFVNLRTTYADIDDIERTTILTKQGKEIAIERPKTSVTFLDLGVLLPTGDAIYSSKPVFVGDNKVPTKYITTIVECRPAQLDKAGIPNANTRFD